MFASPTIGVDTQEGFEEAGVYHSSAQFYTPLGRSRVLTNPAQAHNFATNPFNYDRTRGIISRYAFVSGWREMDAVQTVYKANSTLSLVNNTDGINLSVRTNDSFTSLLNGQVDLAFPYKSISLTSPDLLAVPERTGDANSLQPILSSYAIPTLFDANAKMTGEVTGFTSTPYGTVSFSEGGARRYHSLKPIPGGLRQFNVTCVLDPKDDSKPKSRMLIPPGGRFSCQLLFVRKV